ncbi:MAG: GNAT family N-acetyltransferase [Treponema sp.]|jgi:GNAT superfamily N-acetyltransferase|nr:GNAT family N-acetyltransferase [Treponema sp.]
MKFELDNILVDDILFHMENKEGSYLLDTRKKNIISVDSYDSDNPDFNDKERFINLPDWPPSEGYRLMEKFASGLKKPVIRQELSDTLNQNKGVFRAYKNVLEQYPETEKQWFAFKNREMKMIIAAWYNGLREEWGLEAVGKEPEDISSIVLEDFEIRENVGFSFTAHTLDGDIAGRINAEKETDRIHISKLEVKEEYRGMGIGKTLLAKLLEKTGKQTVTIDVPAESEFFSQSICLEGFKPFSVKYILQV